MNKQKKEIKFVSPGVSTKTEPETYIPRLDNSALIKIEAFEDIRTLIKKYPNDQEFGYIIRNLINQTEDKLKIE